MSRGSDWLAEVLETYSEPDAMQRRVLDDAAAILDETELLEAALASDGTTIVGGNGQTVVHPAFAALRAHRVAFARLCGTLGLDADDSPRTVAARRAANARWRKT